MENDPVDLSPRRIPLLVKALALLGALGLILLLVLPGADRLRSAQATGAKPDRIPVRFWHMWTAEWQAVVERIAARFNQSQDRFQVLPLSVPDDGASAKFLLAVVGGDPPDVMAQWNPVIAPWADNRLLQPLDELMTPEERKRFRREAYPIVQKLGTYKGRLYGLTTGVDAFACYYRPDHFREAGLDPDHFPRTFEELLAIGSNLHRFDARGNLVRVGFLPQTFYQLAPVFGGGFYDPRTGQPTLNTPENRRALACMVETRRQLGFENVLRFTSGLSSDYGAAWPFITGAYSIIQDGQWRVEQLRKSAPDLEYRVAPIPPPRGGRRYAGSSSANYMIIPRGARQVEGAWEFVKFWSGLDQPERAAEFYTWGGWLPMSPVVARAPAYQAYLRKFPAFRTFLEILPSENIQPTPSVPYQMYLLDRIKDVDDLATHGSKTPEQALEWLEAQVARERARRKAMGYAE